MEIDGFSVAPWNGLGHDSYLRVQLKITLQKNRL